MTVQDAKPGTKTRNDLHPHGLDEVQRLTRLIEEREAEVDELRKQRDSLITQLTQPPHNHTYQAVASAAGITRQAVQQIRAKHSA